MSAEVRTDRSHDGRLRAWVCTDWDRVRLRQCADLVEHAFAGEARDRVAGADLVFWDFQVGDALVTLQLERGLGIAVLANDSSPLSEALILQIARHLAERAQSASP